MRGAQELVLGDVLARSLQISSDGVRVAAVLEPLKVRLVTCGDALSYTAAMPIQRAMHGYLKRMPQFALIGRPLGVEDLNWLSQESEKLHLEGELFWVSGDYSSATDRINIEATKAVFEEFLARTTSDDAGFLQQYREVCRHVLYEQTVSYPTLEGQPEVDSFRQANGQLMGSPLSFPVLCVINLMTYWHALEHTLGRRFSANQLPVKVNGDDILFRANRELYDQWVIFSGAYGFVLSPGKNLIHPKIAVINSEQWMQKGGQWVPVPYFNVGLLLGKGKVSEAAAKSVEGGDVNPKAVGPRLNKLLHGIPNPKRAFGRFVTLNKERILRETAKGKANLFVDPVLGGLGVRSHPDIEFKVTRFQRRVAQHRIEKFSGQVVAKGPSIARYEALLDGFSKSDYDLTENPQGSLVLCQPESTPIPPCVEEDLQVKRSNLDLGELVYRQSCRLTAGIVDVFGSGFEKRPVKTTYRWKSSMTGKEERRLFKNCGSWVDGQLADRKAMDTCYKVYNVRPSANLHAVMLYNVGLEEESEEEEEVVPGMVQPRNFDDESVENRENEAMELWMDLRN